MLQELAVLTYDLNYGGSTLEFLNLAQDNIPDRYAIGFLYSFDLNFPFLSIELGFADDCCKYRAIS
ncbi:MAG: hypothetical protein B9J98_03305 [Candidatus Terraquivivens tikiterensis]|uniref:Uncharacterized protein n=1 Tax=Candidatus Terraquivivens tikiterensis TaxID=1980982 RepID=A0A2R7Y6C9_9ARCH|nr:MAG: hypothetical protein B9J98_03305 [Candidatus Terraquivivens tikiterensis]